MKKHVAEIFLLMKKTTIGVSLSKNKSVDKIVGQLVVQKRVCDQKLLQKTVYDRKTFDAEEVIDKYCAMTKRVCGQKNTLIFVINCQKFGVDEKSFLENL